MFGGNNANGRRNRKRYSYFHHQNQQQHHQEQGQQQNLSPNQYHQNNNSHYSNQTHHYQQHYQQQPIVNSNENGSTNYNNNGLLPTPDYLPEVWTSSFPPPFHNPYEEDQYYERSFSYMNGEVGNSILPNMGSGSLGMQPIQTGLLTTGGNPYDVRSLNGIRHGGGGGGGMLQNTLVAMDGAGGDYNEASNRSNEQNSFAHSNNPDISIDSLKQSLLSQLEYYFSPENLAIDKFLVSQMDSDHYVYISTLANFNMVKKLTSNQDLVTEVLKGSKNVQVHPDGKRVRPISHRTVVILRGIPETTPVKEITALFENENCPRSTGCEFAFNDSWYISFESDEDAQRAHKFLREVVKEFKGQPVMARIKSRPTTLLAQGVGMHTMKNGYQTPSVMSTPYISPSYVSVAQPNHSVSAPMFTPGQGQVQSVFTLPPTAITAFGNHQVLPWPGYYEMNPYSLNGLPMQPQSSPGYQKSAQMPPPRQRNPNNNPGRGPRRPNNSIVSSGINSSQSINVGRVSNLNNEIVNTIPTAAPLPSTVNTQLTVSTNISSTPHQQQQQQQQQPPPHHHHSTIQNNQNSSSLAQRKNISNNNNNNGPAPPLPLLGLPSTVSMPALTSQPQTQTSSVLQSNNSASANSGSSSIVITGTSPNNSQTSQNSNSGGGGGSGRNYPNSQQAQHTVPHNVPETSYHHNYPPRQFRDGRPKSSMASRKGPPRNQRDDDGINHSFDNNGSNRVNPSSSRAQAASSHHHSNHHGHGGGQYHHNQANSHHSSHHHHHHHHNQPHPHQGRMNFDLEGSAFPPLPGSVNPSMKNGDSPYEGRLSDVVKGVKNMKMSPAGSTGDKDEILFSPGGEIIVSAEEHQGTLIVSAASPPKDSFELVKKDVDHSSQFSAPFGNKKEFREVGVGSADDNHDIRSPQAMSSTNISNKNKVTADKSTRTDEALLNGDQQTAAVTETNNKPFSGSSGYTSQTSSSHTSNHGPSTTARKLATGGGGGGGGGGNKQAVAMNIRQNVPASGVHQHAPVVIIGVNSEMPYNSSSSPLTNLSPVSSTGKPSFTNLSSSSSASTGTSNLTFGSFERGSIVVSGGSSNLQMNSPKTLSHNAGRNERMGNAYVAKYNDNNNVIHHHRATTASNTGPGSSHVTNNSNNNNQNSNPPPNLDKDSFPTPGFNSKVPTNSTKPPFSSVTEHNFSKEHSSPPKVNTNRTDEVENTESSCKDDNNKKIDADTCSNNGEDRGGESTLPRLSYAQMAQRGKGGPQTVQSSSGNISASTPSISQPTSAQGAGAGGGRNEDENSGNNNIKRKKDQGATKDTRSSYSSKSQRGNNGGGGDRDRGGRNNSERGENDNIENRRGGAGRGDRDNREGDNNRDNRGGGGGGGDHQQRERGNGERGERNYNRRNYRKKMT